MSLQSSLRQRVLGTRTASIKYTTLEDVKNTIDKLEKLYKNKK